MLKLISINMFAKLAFFLEQQLFIVLLHHPDVTLLMALVHSVQAFFTFNFTKEHSNKLLIIMP